MKQRRSIIEDLYKAKTRYWSIYLATALTTLFLLILLSLGIGSTGYCIPFQASCNELVAIRAPRTIAGASIGALLGAGGVLLQAVTRNPLAEPFILGLSSGALALTSLAILAYPLLLYDPTLLSLIAFIGSITAYAITTIIAEYAGGGALVLVLAGVSVNAFFSGISQLFSFLVQIMLHKPLLVLLLGTLAYTSWSDAWLSIIAAASTMLLCLLLSKPLNTIMYGDIYSSQLGFNPVWIRRVSAALAALYTGVSVAIAGIIGFIGLMSPHIARMLLKTSDHHYIILFSVLLGAIILLAADIVARSAATMIGELPVGIYTSIIGGFFLAYLIGKKLKGIEHWS